MLLLQRRLLFNRSRLEQFIVATKVPVRLAEFALALLLIVYVSIHA